MKNEHDPLDAHWADIRACGEAALRPRFAGRVMERAQRLREEMSAASTFTLGLGTALACLTLTLTVSAWKAHHDSDTAVAQWEAFASNDTQSDSET